MSLTGEEFQLFNRLTEALEHNATAMELNANATAGLAGDHNLVLSIQTYLNTNGPWDHDTAQGVADLLIAAGYPVTEP